MHIIEESQGTLKDASLDSDGKTYMTESQFKVCLFDKVKEKYVKEVVPFANPNPKSNDALFFERDSDECYFIEFKNGHITNYVNFEINKKIYDSLFILFDLKYYDRKNRLVDSISYTRKNMTYILVYNEENYSKERATNQTRQGIERQRAVTESRYRDKLYKNIRSLAKEDLILFGLDQFKNYLFKNVYTYTEEEFNNKFVQQHTVMS